MELQIKNKRKERVLIIAALCLIKSKMLFFSYKIAKVKWKITNQSREPLVSLELMH